MSNWTIWPKELNLKLIQKLKVSRCWLPNTRGQLSFLKFNSRCDFISFQSVFKLFEYNLCFRLNLSILKMKINYMKKDIPRTVKGIFQEILLKHTTHLILSLLQYCEIIIIVNSAKWNIIYRCRKLCLPNINFNQSFSIQWLSHVCALVNELNSSVNSAIKSGFKPQY